MAGEVAVSPTAVAAVLPAKYRVYLDALEAMEAVLALLRSRRRAAAFSEVRRSVEVALGSAFTLSHLARLQHLLPDALVLQRAKVGRRAGRHGDAKGDGEILIDLAVPGPTQKQGPGDRLVPAPRSNRELLAARLHELYLSAGDGPMPDVPLGVLPGHGAGALGGASGALRRAGVAGGPSPSTPASTGAASTAGGFGTQFDANVTPPAQGGDALGEEERRPDGDGDDNDGLPGPRSMAPSPSKRQTTMARVSPTLLAAVRARQETSATTSNADTRDSRRRARLASYLPEVFDAIRSVLSTKKVSVMPLDMLAESVGKRMPRNIVAAEVVGAVGILVEAVPHWVSVEERTSFLNRDAGLSKLVRVNRSQDLTAVRKAVAAFAVGIEESIQAAKAVS